MGEVEAVLQVRKQYTITKPREKWLEEEHNKFLEAVQIHGRSWRLIEEHIGTKTAVQIRSHAQKFASKMARDANVNITSNMKPFKIPPPRPKKKPTHPYPRKQIHSEHNRSPSSAQSAVGLCSIDMFLSNNSNRCASPVELQPGLNHHESGVLSAKNSVEGDDTHLSLSLAFPGITTEDEPNLELNLNSSMEHIHSRDVSSSEPTSSFKLFGTTLMIPDSYKQLPAISAEADHSSFQDMIAESDCNAEDSDSGKPAEEPTNEDFPMNGTWLVGFTPACYCLPAEYGTEPNSADEAQVIPTPWFSFYSNMPFPSAYTQQLMWSREDLNQANLQNECSGTGSNTGQDGASAVKSKQDECGDDDEEGFSVVRKSRKMDDGSAASCSKGFVPYRRCDSGEKVKRPSSDGESVGDS